ncbi:MAG TPA: thiamine pyrophosphate-dependent enzyme [Candidatus Lokiarchaeia archaeon]|nr:thiamine pyrophosphate-dependent enzyme [Candidatus Lokiarchaeia archaeon]
MSSQNPFDLPGVEIHWCPGCGNYGALRVLKETLLESGLTPDQVVIVTGIGQAGKTNHFMNANSFNGLHGRYLSTALGIKASNPTLKVIAISGDGCTYSEGGNHFIHAIRYNPDILNIVHNNGVFGLTKGQASPTSAKGYVTRAQAFGVYNTPINAPAIAIALGASFVARAFVGDMDKTKEIYKEAMNNKGYTLIEMFSPCVSFNHVNTFQWYKENTCYLDEAHDPMDQAAALNVVLREGKLALGVIYRNPTLTTFNQNIRIYETDDRPLYTRDVDMEKIKELVDSFR